MSQLRITLVILGIVTWVGLLYVFGIIPQEIAQEPPISSPVASPVVLQIPASLPPMPTPTANRLHRVTIKTSLGSIVFETYDADAPKTVQNFITLAQKGFYDNLTFYRMIRGFMIEGGDPNNDGTGGPGYVFGDELNPSTESYKKGYVKGAVAMAHLGPAMASIGPHMNGSKFFIMLEHSPVPRSYTIFGQVISGQNVVDAIGHMDTNEMDLLLDPVVIQEVTVSKK
ncbi:MAG: peptidylprolyl isomerase [bacterium]|nr:peptidylprolyl isomerase [bacterium]